MFFHFKLSTLTTITEKSNYPGFPHIWMDRRPKIPEVEFYCTSQCRFTVPLTAILLYLPLQFYCTSHCSFTVPPTAVLLYLPLQFYCTSHCSFTVPPTAVLLNRVSGTPVSYSTSARLKCRPANCIIREFSCTSANTCIKHHNST
jgi:hypothetical protein